MCEWGATIVLRLTIPAYLSHTGADREKDCDIDPAGHERRALPGTGRRRRALPVLRGGTRREERDMSGWPDRARYLTMHDKRRVLTAWRADLDSQPRTGPDLPGGRGGVDDGIVPWCDEFNNLPGVVTLQSCVGHAPREGDGEYQACLWLWLSMTRAAAMYATSPQVAGLAGVDRVSVLWQPDGQEVWSVVFAGPAQGGDLANVLGPVLSAMTLAQDEPLVDQHGWPWSFA